MRKITLTILIALIVPTCIPHASAFSQDVTKKQLQDNLSLILPSASSIDGLSGHSNWQEINRATNSYSIEATYQALYDDSLGLTSELPTIYMYIIPYESEYSMKMAFSDMLNRDEFDSEEWILLTSTSTSFSYKTEAGQDSDLYATYSSESNTLHYITQKDNLIIVTNFYREGGVYNRGNVLAYENYVLDYEDTLEVLKSAATYVKESVDFYLGSIQSSTGPTDFDYYLTSANYNLDLSSIYSIPRNGAIQFDIYLDETSEIGTILDSAGINKPQYGSISLGIDENAILDFNLYDPYTDSACDDSAGWHHIYSTEPVDLYEWTTVRIEYGAKTGMNIYINGRQQSHCEAYTARSTQHVYLGDYPEDIIEESFVGYMKDITTAYSYNDSSQKLDDVAAGYGIFTDVPGNHPYAIAISYLKDEGIINGYSDGSFKPDQEINRAEILKMLLLGFDYGVPDADGGRPFSDVESGSWYEKYVLYAYESGIVAGYSDGTFKPAQNLNKVEFLKILTRAYGINLTDYPVTEIYNDTSEAEWYAPYVQYSKDNDLMDVGGDGLFNPAEFVTRGEVAETIYRILILQN